MFLFALFACSGSEDTIVGDATAGETVYATTCAGCHGTDGEGGTGPAMTDEVPELTDEEIEDVILNGAGTMAPVDLIDQDRADVIAYLRATFG